MSDLEWAIEVLNNWTKPDFVRLHAGEMTPQEMRNLVACIKAIIATLETRKGE